MPFISAKCLPPLLIASFAVFGCRAETDIAAQNFSDKLRSFCGQAFAGQLVTDDPEDAAWRDADIKMHMFDCTEGSVKIALHVGGHRSMTWIVSEEAGALTLLHDHRQKDGSPHAFTDFGGSAEIVTDSRAEFPANPQSVDTFDRLGLPDAAARKWAMDI